MGCSVTCCTLADEHLRTCSVVCVGGSLQVGARLREMRWPAGSLFARLRVKRRFRISSLASVNRSRGVFLKTVLDWPQHEHTDSCPVDTHLDSDEQLTFLFCFGIKNYCLDSQRITDLIFQLFNLFNLDFRLNFDWFRCTRLSCVILKSSHWVIDSVNLMDISDVKFSVCMYAIIFFFLSFVFGPRPRVSDVVIQVQSNCMGHWIL